VLIVVLWRAYDNRVQEHIRDLRYIASIRHENPAEGWDSIPRAPERKPANVPYMPPPGQPAAMLRKEGAIPAGAG
jgi:hypothetical protein